MIVVERPSEALMQKGPRTARCGDPCPACRRWPRPPCPSPDMRWAYRGRPCARRPAGPGGDVRGSAPRRADRGSDSDYNILTMAISSTDPVYSCAQAFAATCVNNPGSWAGTALLVPAGFTRP